MIDFRKAYSLQLEYNFCENVTTTQLIAWFPQAFPEYRLTIVDLQKPNFQDCTVQGASFTYDENDHSKLIYLIYDITQMHYGLCESPKNYIRNTRHSDSRWCDKCVAVFKQDNPCLCNKPFAKRICTGKECEFCGKKGCKPQFCLRKCGTCFGVFRGGYNFDRDRGHRCIVYKPLKNCEFWQQGDPEDGKKPMLWAYDLESANEACSEQTNAFTAIDGRIYNINSVIVERRRHIVNLLVAKNVFGSETIIENDYDSCIENFLVKLKMKNKGNHICVAHNGAAYDSRLIFERSTIVLPDDKRNAVTNGTKFTDLEIGCIKFRDSILHLPGSLKALAKSFALPVQKGYFPHLFNTQCNFDYRGRIPDEKYFDLTWSVKTDADVAEFREWYNSESQQNVEWNFQHELLKYCLDDVEILAQVMHKFHTICDSKFQVSPWMYTTGPSFVHNLIIGKLSDDEMLRLPDVEDGQARHWRVQELAEKEHWAVLTTNEYFFARNALRGGRTDVRCILRELTEEEKARGCRIVYQDMVSMYPAVQMKYDYPVGYPEIYVYGDEYYPCVKHQNPEKGNIAPLKCTCTWEFKSSMNKGQMNVTSFAAEEQPPPQMLETFFGFICATIEPPKNLYHPVLVAFDEDSQKCVGSLQTLKEQVFTSVEFQLALKEGYKVLKVHRIDWYRKKPGLWRDFIRELYIEKMANSEPPPPQEKQQNLVNAYEEKFEMGALVQDSFSRWKTDKALRLVYKIMLNCGWGKHCQRPNMPKTIILNNSNTAQVNDFYDDVQKQKVSVSTMHRLGEISLVKTSNVCGEKKRFDFHDSYLPAGVFVPSYGRIELYKQLSKLGKRALYHDTDSIIYVYDPNEYNIPTSDILGDWSEEDISKEGIVKFIGLGPKSYGLKTTNGECVKVKGLSLKRCNRHLLDFSKFEQIVKDHFNGVHNEVLIPQMNFQYTPGTGISTTYNLKRFCFQPESLKGNLHGVYVYPKGYCEQCIIDENHCQ